MRKLCKSLSEHAKNIINFEKKKKILLANKAYKSNLNQINCHISKNTFGNKCTNDKNYYKVKDHSHFYR